MLILRTRRPARTISGLHAHQVNWHAANDHDVDDPLATARGLVNGVLLGVALWIVAGFAWWIVHLLATGA